MLKRGRPTNYTSDFPDKALQYIESGWKKDEVMPTAAGLALYLGVPREKLYIYAKLHKDFRHILGVLNALQEKRLLTGGLGNKFNATIVKLVLAKHGYREGVDIESPELTSEIEKLRKDLKGIFKDE